MDLINMDVSGFTLTPRAEQIFANEETDAGTEQQNENPRTVAEDTVTISDQARALQSTFSQANNALRASPGDEQMNLSGKSGALPTLDSGSAAQDDESDIEELEEKIQQLEQMIDELRAKAGSDPDAKDELKVKEVELMGLQSELAQLQESQAAAMG